MKSLVEYISEAKFNRNIEFYDLNIVSESLKDPKLIELAKYLKKFASKSYYNYSFGGLFSQFGVEWDKITESDWETGYVIAELASGRFFREGAPDMVLRTVGNMYITMMQ